ncbi:gibberellin-regulated protein [Canna indica]|uniref:Gibberellin-regulated protein n=1 Tax=Canna indica TaxID=4628 RepID=A0AAQ3KT87_9LILI|nr:gibberellin-regulated protein [Canna indica]
MNSCSKKLLPSSLLIIYLFLHVVAEAYVDNTAAKVQGKNIAALDGIHPPPKINCDLACAMRCKKASRKNVCSRACSSCCLRCQCVPPGTSGNKNLCPCYANLTTRGRKPKCP